VHLNQPKCLYDAAMKVYTKTGDKGETSLASGDRVAKDSTRIEAYGTIDELSSHLGLLRTEPLPSGVAKQLVKIQETLFVIGGTLADPSGRFGKDPKMSATEALERGIDAMEGELEALRSFILPSGSRAASLAHVARTVCRRAERRVVSAHQSQSDVPAGLLAFLNRLSDYLFVLARFLNARLGIAEQEWHPP
jgi:cob(I)alamin adenosyltransferase